MSRSVINYVNEGITEPLIKFKSEELTKPLIKFKSEELTKPSIADVKKNAMSGIDAIGHAHKFNNYKIKRLGTSVGSFLNKGSNFLKDKINTLKKKY